MWMGDTEAGSKYFLLPIIFFQTGGRVRDEVHGRDGEPGGRQERSLLPEVRDTWRLLRSGHRRCIRPRGQRGRSRSGYDRRGEQHGILRSLRRTRPGSPSWRSLIRNRNPTISFVN